MKYKYILLASVLCFISVGCATVPGRLAFPYQTITMNATQYFAVLPMCEKEGIAWDYDPLSRVLILKKDKQELKLLVSSRTITVGDMLKSLPAPVELRDSVIYAPVEVRDYIIPPVCKFPEQKKVTGAYLKPVDFVILDAGHGGKDPGAIGRQGLREKDIVLDLTERLQSELERCSLKVGTTRSSDEFIQLGDRSSIANHKKADLFVSIHANANRSRWVEGFEVYYLTEAVDDDARALAAAENAPLGIDGDSLHSRFSSIKAMLWDMIYTENRKESIELAHFISKAVTKRMGLKMLGVKGAPFAVLKGAQMPAVLLEIGYISNRDGERKLRDASYRQAMAESIAQGIINFKNYCEGKK